MSAFLECPVCLTRIILRDDRGLTERDLARHFRSQGWQIHDAEPHRVRCPQHKGTAGMLRTWAARLSRAQCRLPHDPEPWLTPAGIATGGMNFGGRGIQPSTLAPQKEFCQDPRHYWRTDMVEILMIPRTT